MFFIIKTRFLISLYIIIVLLVLKTTSQPVLQKKTIQTLSSYKDKAGILSLSSRFN